MTTRSILIEELNNGPLSTELDPLIASQNYSEIVSVLNRADIPTHKIVDTLLIRQYLILRDLLIPLKLNVTSPICLTAIEALYTFPSMDLRQELIYNKIVSLLDALIEDPAAPDFTQQDKAYILSLGDTFTSRAAIILGRDVQEIEIRDIIWNADGSLNTEVM